MGVETIFSGLNVSGGVAAIFAVGALVAGIGFVSWLVDKVAGFFYSQDEDDEFIHSPDSVVEGETYTCPECEYEMDSDHAMHALSEGYCPKCGEAV